MWPSLLSLAVVGATLLWFAWKNHQEGAGQRALFKRFPWIAWFQAWLDCKPLDTHPEGLKKCRTLIQDELMAMGFVVSLFPNPGNPATPVLVAIRHPDQKQDSPAAVEGFSPAPTVWLGLNAHYDVEQRNEIKSAPWRTNWLQATEVDGRIYARGIADNLGPLAQRLYVLKQIISEGEANLPGIIFFLHGEEEIESERIFALRLYPKLMESLPKNVGPVSVWLEETGYFKGDTQRLLTKNLEGSNMADKVNTAIDRVHQLAQQHDRKVDVQHRFLNKKIPDPGLAHLIKENPYVSFGPNDGASRIHATNESLPVSTLALSELQWREFLQALA